MPTPIALRCLRPIGMPSALSVAPAERRERLDANESTEAAEPAEPTESTEQAEPIEPIERTEPTDPIERIEPSLAIERIEPMELTAGTVVAELAQLSLDAWCDI